jgi:putative transposase
MPRTGRVILPNYPHHVVQRGHNRQIVFPQSQDYRYYLDTLLEWKAGYDIKVYAWCLMTNHVHLVLEPPEAVENLGRLMKRLAGRQTRYVNRRLARSGTLWEGRYKSSPIQTDAYFLACCRYVELNPVRAGMVADPDSYPWSSYCSRPTSSSTGLLDEHPTYRALGRSPVERLQQYRQFVRAGTPDAELQLIRQSLQRCQLTGDGRFVDTVERLTGRRVEHKAPGRQPLPK